MLLSVKEEIVLLPAEADFLQNPLSDVVEVAKFVKFLGDPENKNLSFDDLWWRYQNYIAAALERMAVLGIPSGDNSFRDTKGKIEASIAAKTINKMRKIPDKSSVIACANTYHPYDLGRQPDTDYVWLFPGSQTNWTDEGLADAMKSGVNFINTLNESKFIDDDTRKKILDQIQAAPSIKMPKGKFWWALKKGSHPITMTGVSGFGLVPCNVNMSIQRIEFFKRDGSSIRPLRKVSGDAKRILRRYPASLGGVIPPGLGEITWPKRRG